MRKEISVPAMLVGTFKESILCHVVTDLKGILKLGISFLFQSVHTSFSPGIPPSFSIPSMLAPTS